MVHKSQETTLANSDFSLTMCLTCTAPHLNQELKPAPEMAYFQQSNFLLCTYFQEEGSRIRNCNILHSFDLDLQSHFGSTNI